MGPATNVTYEMIDPPFPMRRLGNTWTIEANGTGTRLTLRPFVELKARPLTKRLEGFVLRRLMKDLESDQRRMKAAVERAVDDLE